MAGALLLLFLVVLPVVAAKDCRTTPDGVFDLGCKSYVRCISGVAHLVDCGLNEVYDSTSQACIDQSHAHGICGTIRDCTSKQDGSYADTESSQSCTTYYTCRGGTFFGHNFCPGGTHFSETLQTCDWPDNLPPPCGTKTS